MKLIISTAALAAAISSSVVFALPVNINQATASEIADALNGVGLNKAQAIVDYRNSHGMFKAASDIVQVKGIGQSIFEKNKDDILIK